MSLEISPQPDGSIIVRCGDDEVTISSQAIPPISTKPVIEPIFPKPGTVVVRWGPGPEDALRLGDDDLADVIAGIEADSEGLVLEIPVSNPQGVDIERLMQLTRQRLGHDIPVELYFKPPDE